jgi:hypothetical protein
MRADAASAGIIYAAGGKYQKIQFFTVNEILAGKRPRLPFPEMPDIFKAAEKLRPRNWLWPKHPLPGY